MRTALFALLLSLGLPAAAQDAVPDDRRPPLFLLEDGDSRVYLLGSVHALPEGVLPLPAHVEAAYADAAVLAFEADLDLVQAGVETMLAAGMDEETVADALTKKQKEAFNTRLTKLGLPAGALNAFEPWLAGLTYGALTIQQSGAATEGGVDAHFFRRAGDDGKERVAFETVGIQTAAFDDLSTESQVAFLMEGVEDDRDPSETFGDMVDAWASGDDEALAAMMADGMSQPEVFEALLVARNRAWIPQIEELLAREDEDALVVVGAGHLVGRESVVEMLREAGYTVARL